MRTKQLGFLVITLVALAAGILLRPRQPATPRPTPPSVEGNEGKWAKVHIEGLQTEYDFGQKTNLILFFDGRFQTTNANDGPPTMYEQGDPVPCRPIGTGFSVGKLGGNSQYLVLFRRGVRSVVWKYEKGFWWWWIGPGIPPPPIVNCSYP